MDSYQARLRAALEAQHRKWFDYARQTMKEEVAEHIACPVCDSTGGDVYFVKDMFRFERCRNCSMVFLNPRLNVRATYDFYNSEWTGIYNETKFTDGATTSEVDAEINKANLKLLAANGSRAVGEKLLEIGFGAGHFLRSASRAGYDVYGIDVDTSNYDRLRKEFPGHILNCDIHEARYPAGVFGVIYMRDVFEHVPNPKPLLKEVHRATKDGGLVFIEVPNIEGLIYKAVGPRHVVVFGFAHLNYWSPATMQKILERTGFEVLQIIHESLDFTVQEVARYYLDPVFTTLTPPATSKAMMALMKLLRRLILRFRLSPLDLKRTPRIADRLRRGSVIRVIARKKAGT